jgi:FeS assembly SUF system regulator
MFRVNKLTDYALELLCQMSRGQVAVLTTTQLAADSSLGLATVSKILKKLARAELVISHRGVKGGYALAKKAKQISVAEVITAMEGNLAMTECTLETGKCELEAHCSIKGPWQVINAALLNALNKLSLEDMTQEKLRFELRPIIST